MTRRIKESKFIEAGRKLGSPLAMERSLAAYHVMSMLGEAGVTIEELARFVQLPHRRETYCGWSAKDLISATHLACKQPSRPETQFIDSLRAQTRKYGSSTSLTIKQWRKLISIASKHGVNIDEPPCAAR